MLCSQLHCRQLLCAALQAAAEVYGELEEAKEARAASEKQVQQLHKQLLTLEENAEADLARASQEVLTPFFAF